MRQPGTKSHLAAISAVENVAAHTLLKPNGHNGFTLGGDVVGAQVQSDRLFLDTLKKIVADIEKGKSVLTRFSIEREIERDLEEVPLKNPTWIEYKPTSNISVWLDLHEIKENE
jgi:hypothetical protein